MTAKRFEVYKVIGSFHEWSIEDNLNDKVVFGCIMHKYEADRLCGLLNELNDENEQLKFQLQNTSDQRDEFHRGARENANRVGKLEKENGQLRHDATILIQANQDYRKENEQLKQQLMDCEKFRHTVFQEISKEMNKHD